MESAGTTSNLARRFEALEQVRVSKSRWLVVCVSCKYREYINSIDLEAVQTFFSNSALNALLEIEYNDPFLTILFSGGAATRWKL